MSTHPTVQVRHSSSMKYPSNEHTPHTVVQVRHSSSMKYPSNEHTPHSASDMYRYLPELLSKNLICLSSWAVIVTGSVGWHTIRFTWLLIGYSVTTRRPQTTTMTCHHCRIIAISSFVLLNINNVWHSSCSVVKHATLATVCFNQSNGSITQCHSQAAVVDVCYKTNS